MNFSCFFERSYIYYTYKFKKIIFKCFVLKGECSIITDQILHESRKTFRVKDNSRISWSLKDGNSKGDARIHNISTSGMLIETNSDFAPQENCIFSFEPNGGKIDFLPDLGRVVWHKAKPFGRNRYLCGIEFINPSENILANLSQKIQGGIMEFTKARRFRTILNIGLAVAVAGLTVYLVWLVYQTSRDMSITTKNMLDVSNKQSSLTREYIRLYKDTKIELDTTKVELATTKDVLSDVTQDLETTKGALQETQGLLAQAKDENIKLGTDLGKMKDLNDKYSKTISGLEEKNTELGYEMKILQDQLSYYAGNVKNVDEGKELIRTFRERMKIVKAKINAFKQEAVKIKAAALKERDHLKSMLGNKGYLVKNGAAVKVDLKEYTAAGSSETKPAESKGRKVNIDVNFFKK
ncbi:MAG: PilZ domain-containing protein [Candidatus Omnitrophica bacterium]|nr:PilZ domain-containing protein [Candidatus Omnitrophota bacterium]